MLRLWSPESPTLCNVDVTLGEDHVTSYAAMRSIGVGEDEGGVPRLLLNGRPYFQNGVLDQEMRFPDRLYTAPSDDAMVFDIPAHEGHGLQYAPQTSKIEPMRWVFITATASACLSGRIYKESPGKKHHACSDYNQSGIQTEKYRRLIIILADPPLEAKSYTYGIGTAQGQYKGCQHRCPQQSKGKHDGSVMARQRFQCQGRIFGRFNGDTVYI